MTAEQIAQWVIDNRYPKSESEKVSDFEMYYEIIEMINTLLNKQDNEGSDTELILKKEIKTINKTYRIGSIKTEKEWMQIIGRQGAILPNEGSDSEYFEYL